MSPNVVKEQDTEIRIVVPARLVPWLYASAAYDEQASVEQFIVKHLIATVKSTMEGAAHDESMPESLGHELNAPKASGDHARN